MRASGAAGSGGVSIGIELSPAYARLSEHRLLTAGVPGAAKGLTLEMTGRPVQADLFSGAE